MKQMIKKMVNHHSHWQSLDCLSGWQLSEAQLAEKSGQNHYVCKKYGTI